MIMKLGVDELAKNWKPLVYAMFARSLKRLGGVRKHMLANNLHDDVVWPSKPFVFLRGEVSICFFKSAS